MLSFNIGPLALPLGHVLLVLGFIMALVVGAIVGRKERIPIGGPLSDIFLAAMLAARIGFVVRYFDHYQNDLLGIIDIRDGGFDIISGVSGALVVLAWKLWRQPAIRRALGSAATAGLLTWGSLTLLITLVEGSARAVPATALADLDRRPVTLADVAGGRPMVVNLWASWCPPCIREMPVLEKAQQDHPDIAFVFVNQGEQPETIRQFMSQQGLSLDNMLTDTNASLGQATGSHGLPTTLFYDAQGRQVSAHMGELSAASLAHNLGRFD